MKEAFVSQQSLQSVNSVSLKWNLYFLIITFLSKSLLSLHLSNEISTLHFSIDIFTLSSLFYSNLYFLFAFLSLFFLQRLWPGFHEALRPPLAFPNNTTHTKASKQQLCTAFHASAYTCFKNTPHTSPHQNFIKFQRKATHSSPRVPDVKAQRFAQFLTFKLEHCPTPATQTASPWLSYLLITRPLYSATWLSYSIMSYLLINYSTTWHTLTELFNCELPLNSSTSRFIASCDKWRNPTPKLLRTRPIWSINY